MARFVTADGTFEALSSVAATVKSNTLTQNSNVKGPGDGSTCRGEFKELASNNRDPCTAKGGWKAVVGNPDSWQCPVDNPATTGARMADGLGCSPDGGVFVSAYGTADGRTKEGLSAEVVRLRLIALCAQCLFSKRVCE